MGLIWYSALMPSLIFVCETKCFDGKWLLKCLCLPKAVFFFFSFFWLRVRVLWPLTVQYTVCLLLKTRTQSIEFWIRFIIPPSSQQLCCQRAACVYVSKREMWVLCLCVCVCVVKVNYCKRLPINLLSWKFKWYCRMHINTHANQARAHTHMHTNMWWATHTCMCAHTHAQCSPLSQKEGEDTEAADICLLQSVMLN